MINESTEASQSLFTQSSFQLCEKSIIEIICAIINKQANINAILAIFPQLSTNQSILTIN